MIKIKKIICLVICISMLGTQAFGFSQAYNEFDIKKSIENTYGINIIIPEGVDYSEFIDCMSILERSIKEFPDNIIKEITDYYLSKGIATNVILDKTEIIKELFTLSIIDESSVNIYIKTLEGSLYSESHYASEQVITHVFSHFISDYMLETYDLDNLKDEFDKLNEGFEYGTWSEEYSKVFVNRHSAISFENDIAHLIWYAEANPFILRNINGGDYAIIHEKLRLIAEEFSKIFNSITENTKLWLDAIPQTPQDWAKDTITEMKNQSLIPDEFNGLYEAYIKRGDFYKLVLNMLHIKLGENELNKYFNLTDYEEHVALDPLRGEVYVTDGLNYTSYYNYLANSSNAFYEAYQMGILNTDSFYEPDEYMTRLEIAKLLAYIANELGMNISEFQTVSFNDIEQVAENEKPYIYIAADKGFIKGDGLNFKPFNYCTYQEAYLILNRFYNSLYDYIQ
ncbi:MAG TPA: S-layer homology domain-containing protein [Sedimentibacter sp.]|nr:S-layer homology domain-containing protein [Sedimentibacter sp.]HQC69801.1 S-layer homology domain-containing protein [Sedimentibacter sp.]